MPKAKKLKGKPIEAYFREPYATVFKLFQRLKNKPLKRIELAFVLLENHGCKTIPKKEIETPDGEKIDLNEIRKFGFRLKNLDGRDMDYHNFNNVLNELISRKILKQNRKKEFYLSLLNEKSVEQQSVIRRINNFSPKEIINENNILFFGLNQSEIKDTKLEEEFNDKVKKQCEKLPMFVIYFRRVWIKHNLQKIAEIIPDFLKEFNTIEEKYCVLGCINKLAEQQIEFLKENPDNFSKEINNLQSEGKKFDEKIKKEFENITEIYEEIGKKMNNALGDKELMTRVFEERGKRMEEFYKRKKEQYIKQTEGKYGNVYPSSIFREMTKEELKMTDYLYVLTEFMLRDGKITEKEFKIRWFVYDFIEIIREKSGKFQELKFLFEPKFPLIVINLSYMF